METINLTKIEFKWGPRAEHEFSQRAALEFMSEVRTCFKFNLNIYSLFNDKSYVSITGIQWTSNKKLAIAISSFNCSRKIR